MQGYAIFTYLSCRTTIHPSHSLAILLGYSSNHLAASVRQSPSTFSVRVFFNNSCQHPLVYFAFAFKNMPKEVGRFFLESLQRPKNKTTTLYTITFLPPGMFLYFPLYRLYNKISSNKTNTANYSFS